MCDENIDYSQEGMRRTALTVVKNMSAKDLKCIAEKLNEKGIITELDHPGFMSSVMEYFTSECSEHLRRYGYKGKDLRVHCKVYDNEANYLLYDPSIYDEYDNEILELNKYLDVERGKNLGY